MAVQIMKEGETLYTLETDENGAVYKVALEAPDLTSDNLPAGAQPFETYDVIVPEANGFKKVSIFGVQIFDGITSVLNIHMEPLTEFGSQETVINLHEESSTNISYNTSTPDEYFETVPVWRETAPSTNNSGLSTSGTRTQMPRTVTANTTSQVLEELILDALRPDDTGRPPADNFDIILLLLAMKLLRR